MTSEEKVEMLMEIAKLLCMTPLSQSRLSRARALAAAALAATAEPSAHVNLTPDGTTVINPGKPFAFAPDARRAELLAAMEKVVRVFAQHIRTSPKFEGQLTTPADNGLLGRVAQDLENLDVAALLEAK